MLVKFMNEIYFCLKPCGTETANKYKGILYVHNRSYMFQLTMYTDDSSNGETPSIEIEENFYTEYNISSLNLNLMLLYCKSIKDLQRNLIIIIEQSIFNQQILERKNIDEIQPITGNLLVYKCLKRLAHMFYYTNNDNLQVRDDHIVLYVEIDSETSLPLYIVYSTDHNTINFEYPIHFDEQTYLECNLLREIKTADEFEHNLKTSILLFKEKLQLYYSNVKKLKAHFSLSDLLVDLIYNNSIEIHCNGLGVEIEHNLIAIVNNVNKDKCRNYLKLSYYGDKDKVRDETGRLLDLYNTEHDKNTDIIDTLRKFIPTLFDANKTENNTNECGICYDSIKKKPVTCSNVSCNTHYHFECLKEWSESGLRNEELFGSIVCDCPYCYSEIIF